MHISYAHGDLFIWNYARCYNERIGRTHSIGRLFHVSFRTICIDWHSRNNVIKRADSERRLVSIDSQHICRKWDKAFRNSPNHSSNASGLTNALCALHRDHSRSAHVTANTHTNTQMSLQIDWLLWAALSLDIVHWALNTIETSDIKKKTIFIAPGASIARSCGSRNNTSKKCYYRAINLKIRLPIQFNIWFESTHYGQVRCVDKWANSPSHTQMCLTTTAIQADYRRPISRVRIALSCIFRDAAYGGAKAKENVCVSVALIVALPPNGAPEVNVIELPEPWKDFNLSAAQHKAISVGCFVSLAPFCAKWHFCYTQIWN